MCMRSFELCPDQAVSLFDTIANVCEIHDLQYSKDPRFARYLDATARTSSIDMTSVNRGEKRLSSDISKTHSRRTLSMYRSPPEYKVPID